MFDAGMSLSLSISLSVWLFLASACSKTTVLIVKSIGIFEPEPSSDRSSQKDTVVPKQVYPKLAHLNRPTKGTETQNDPRPEGLSK